MWNMRLNNACAENINSIKMTFVNTFRKASDETKDAR